MRAIVIKNKRALRVNFLASHVMHDHFIYDLTTSNYLKESFLKNLKGTYNE